MKFWTVRRFDGCINEINAARSAIAKKMNQTTISVYWNIGKLLSEKSITEGYGIGVIKKLSSDLKAEFSDMGLTPWNLWDMKKFCEYFQFIDTKNATSIFKQRFERNIKNFERTWPSRCGCLGAAKYLPQLQRITDKWIE